MVSKAAMKVNSIYEFNRKSRITRLMLFIVDRIRLNTDKLGQKCESSDYLILFDIRNRFFIA